ncbi:MAG: histidine phosphatase family protein [Phenylobacterium sp.]|jgi:phosphohistidine phosphatase|uniref:SixA phosphatase family protein n=1 Tax=Phenylobacterium sp. TaxID=1871053 RepID=UPI0025DAB958|nr:histidine phosphatase family protein [Phenylobacterium sp.]MCA3714228.1 histidine phosphatase family protein [Phenylobacterium sp.]MCA3730747.1 histidine phosphatase family protein [Phenylobacterium sp.]MCA3735239.1 histidine phosphatase family protein [Phenylobacterium sp.]MCA3737523.1 histidine phosphatase family protein [Phenylobacterium sp.]MCA3740340.1 histidine phosphatase family protein [Phenylobacterium sp.]
MDRLILLRHGEAEAGSETGGDFGRRLTARGREASAAVASALADVGLIPDLALVSAAVRTRETWAAMSGLLPGCEVRFEDALYLAEASEMQLLVREAGGAGVVLVVGHNPGLQELAEALMMEASGPAGTLSRIRAGFPTSAAVAFAFDVNGRPVFDGFFQPDPVG